MSGELSQKDRFQHAFHILRQAGNETPDAKKIEAVVFAMANKFLESVDFDELKEEFKMTELGLFLYNDGKADGIEQASLDNARNLLNNGISYEIVRNSIEQLTDKQLTEIYDEIMASKQTSN